MKAANLAFFIIVTAGAGVAFAQEGTGQGPPHAKHAPATSPAKATSKTPKAPVHAPAAARPRRPH